MKIGLKSIIRKEINKMSMLLIKNELLRKNIIVLIYNFKCFFRINKKEKNNEFLFQPDILIRNKRFIFSEFYKGNCLYGISNVLKEYCNYNDKIYACIEHGVYFGEYINEREAINSGLPALITFSKKRIEHIRKKSQKQAFSIGPYIYYARSLLNDKEITKYKKEHGRILLVFPSHSIDRVKTSFNYEDFINQIEQFKRKNKFDNVLVCLYYRDIELKRHNIYKEAGYNVVCAGRREDPCFLRRLKTYFEISDYSISNSIGTHIGYSIALNIPHTVIPQQIDYDMTNKLEKENVPVLYNSSSVYEKKEVEKEFLNYSEKITKSQIDICNKYWGNDLIKTRKEMFDIFNTCKETYKGLKTKK